MLLSISLSVSTSMNPDFSQSMACCLKKQVLLKDLGNMDQIEQKYHVGPKNRQYGQF